MDSNVEFALNEINKKVDDDFYEMLLGKVDIGENPIIINVLYHAYNTGKVQKLDEIHILRFCCTALQKYINDSFKERIREINYG